MGTSSVNPCTIRDSQRRSCTRPTPRLHLQEHRRDTTTLRRKEPTGYEFTTHLPFPVPSTISIPRHSPARPGVVRAIMIVPNRYLSSFPITSVSLGTNTEYLLHISGPLGSNSMNNLHYKIYPQFCTLFVSYLLHIFSNYMYGVYIVPDDPITYSSTPKSPGCSVMPHLWVAQRPRAGGLLPV